MKTQNDDLKKIIIKILKKYDVKRASLFGSMARGEISEKSDVDLLVEFEGKKSLLDLAALKSELQKSLRKKVDVLTYKSIHPLLKEKILGEQEVVI